MINDEGRYLFFCSFRVGDHIGSINIWAYDWDEAEAIIAGMRNSLSVDCQVLEYGDRQEMLQ